MPDVKGVSPNATVLKFRRSRKRTVEENKALDARAATASCFWPGCSKKVTRHVRHSDYSCSQHWEMLGLMEAAKVEGWKKTYGTERATFAHTREVEQRHALRTARYRRSLTK